MLDSSYLSRSLCAPVRRALSWAALPGVAVALLTLGAPAAHAAPPPSVPAYGQIASIGGFDSGATYTKSSSSPAAATTTGLTAGKFVLPVGMAVDTTDSTAPGNAAIYVLDEVNPQALDPIFNSGDPTTQSLTYRIQKLAIKPDGTEQVLGAASFTLASSATHPGEQAVSLAVDPTLGRVYVLIDDVPSNNTYSYPDAEKIVAFTTAVTNGALTAPAGMAADTETGGGLFVGPSTLQKGNANLGGDILGESIAMAGTGASAELALAGDAYDGTTNYKPIPTIEKFTAAGAVDGTPWQNAPGAENAIAQKDAHPQGAGYLAPFLYGMSANPDGSLNVTLGQELYGNSVQGNADSSDPDQEPWMATVTSDLSLTTPILPAPNTATSQGNGGLVNSDIAATVATQQVPYDQFFNQYNPTAEGGTVQGGTLGPSVTALAGDGTNFPSGLYAGLVVQQNDQNLDASGSPVTNSELAWTPETTNSSNTQLVTHASFGIRVFDGAGDSLAMIGNRTYGGACNLSGGTASIQNSSAAHLLQTGIIGSMMALAPGANGTLYALTQPDLTNPSSSSSPIDPASPFDSSGDRLVELGPGAGTQCPQPAGAFSVTNLSRSGSTPDTKTGPLTVPAGTKLQFDASTVDLKGGVPWTYNWDLAGGAGNGLVSNTFTPVSTNGSYKWASPQTTFTYNTPGTYSVKLGLVNDFGTLNAQRTINVVQPGPVTAAFTSGGGGLPGQAVAFDASGSTAPQYDSFADYHWDFGDGQSDDQPGPQDAHTYAAAGTYQVTLTVTDGLGQTNSVTHAVTITNPPPPSPSGSGGTGSGSPSGGGTPPPNPPAQAADRSPTNVSPRAMAGNGAVKVTVSCPASKASCAGLVQVRTVKAFASSARSRKKGKKVKMVTLVLGQGSFSLAAGAQRTMTITLSGKAGALLANGASLPVRVIVSAHDSFGDPSTRTLTVVLHAARPHHATKTKHHR